MAQIKVTQDIVDKIGLSRPKLIEMIRAGQMKGTVTDKTIMLDESEIPSSAKVNPQTGEVQMTPQEKARAELDAKKIQLETQAIDQGFKNMADFLEQRTKQLAKQTELDKREEGIKTREDILTKREIECEANSKKNDAVRATIKNNEIEAYKKALAVREYAFRHYFENLDTLFAKIVNGRCGKNCYGIVLRNNKRFDEPVVIDQTYREECITIINQILPVLKLSPKFDKETNEYLGSVPNEEFEEDNDQDVNISTS